MKKKLLAIALSTIGAVGAVQAGAVAQSRLDITNLILRNDLGGAVLTAAQFDVLQITDTTNLNPTLTPGGANPYTNSTSGGAPLPLTVVCVPVACPPALTAPGPFGNATTPATVNGALAASELNGAPIAGLTTGSPPVAIPVGLNARTNAVAERTTTGTGNTTAALSTAVQFSFSPTSDIAIRIDFNAVEHLLAFLDSQTNAFAGASWNVHIQDQAGATVFDWTPNGLAGGITGGTEILDPCSLTRSVTAFGPSANFTQDCAGSFSARTNLLLAANTYNASITHQNQANVLVAQAVPEPSMLSLLGLALAGIGFTTRRKSKA